MLESRLRYRAQYFDLTTCHSQNLKTTWLPLCLRITTITGGVRLGNWGVTITSFFIIITPASAKSNCRIQFLLALFDYNQNVQRSLNVNVTHKVWQQSTSFTNSQYCNAAPFNKLTAAKELVKLDRTHDYKISVLGIGGLPIGTAMHRSRPLM